MRVALHGLPGAGKSTFSRLLKDELAKLGTPSLTLRLGAPLYEAQAVIHTMAGAPMLTPDQQDGQLLNALGLHFRRINPQALTAPFTHRVHQAATEHPDAWLICDDMRPADADAVHALGFKLVELHAPDAVRHSRKAQRGDLTSGDDNHPTEGTVQRTSDLQIRNAGTLEDLRERAEWLVKGGLA